MFTALIIVIIAAIAVLAYLKYKAPTQAEVTTIVDDVKDTAEADIAKVDAEVKTKL